jgi:dolichol-phosphate mannosyltransferase
MNKLKLLSIIVPTYNQEMGINEFYARIKAVLKSIEHEFDYEIVFVNDFSRDNTKSILRNLAKFDTKITVINFSRNFGNQIGIAAGIDHCRGDIAVIIDDDLQDPPEVILEFIKKWNLGYKVVYGIRKKRPGVSIAFRALANLYYRILNKLADIEIPNDTGDFRLIDKVIIDSLRKIKEENRYYRGLVTWLGYPQIGVVYERDERYAGKSNFSFGKYFNFAINGITAFTDKPLRILSFIGLFITSIAFFLIFAMVLIKLFYPQITIQGWTSLMILVTFFGGVQLLSIGILGIYVGKIYTETKGRPLYLIESIDSSINSN